MRTIKYLSIAAILLLVGLFYYDNSDYISRSFQRFVDGFFSFLIVLVWAAGIGGAVILGLVVYERFQKWRNERNRQRDGSLPMQSRKGKDGRVHVLVPSHMIGATATFDEVQGWIEPEPAGGYTSEQRLIVRVEAQRTAHLQAIAPGDEVLKLAPMLGKAAASGSEKILKALGGKNDAQTAQKALTGPVGEDADMYEPYIAMTGVQAVMQATPNNFIYGQAQNGALCKVDMHSSVNVGIVGAPGCGKTASSGYQTGLNVLNFGGRLIVLDGKGGIDWKMFARVAEHHMMDGGTLADQMHYIHQEYERRMAMVARYKVQHMSELQHPEFPPIYVIVEEYGINAADMGKKDSTFCDGIINEMTKKGRVTDIHFIVIDQNPKETWSQMLLMATKAKLVYQMGPNQGNTVGEWHAQNLPDKGAFFHRKVQYDAWFMAPELEGMLKQVPTNPWPALMPDVTDWKQPFYPGNAGGPPIVMRPAQIGQEGQMSGHVSGQRQLSSPGQARPGVVQAQARGQGTGASEEWKPVDPDAGRVTNRGERVGREGVNAGRGESVHSVHSHSPSDRESVSHTGRHTPEGSERGIHSERSQERVNSVNAAGLVDTDGWIVTSPQHRQALGMRERMHTTEVTEETEKFRNFRNFRNDGEETSEISVDQQNVRDNVQTTPRTPASSRRAPKPVEPTLTEKQEKVFAYFEANAQYDRVKAAWVFPTVATMVEELGVSAGYITGLKFEWLEDKVFEEDGDAGV